MQQMVSRLKNVFTPQVVTFIAGLLAALVSRAIFGNLIPLDVGTLLLLVIILVVLTMAVMVSLRQDITSRLAKSGLVAQTYYATGAVEGDRFLYDPITEKIRSAQKSLRIVGFHRSPGSPSSLARERYFAAIDELLLKHHEGGSRFRFERILQSESTTPGTIPRSALDQQMFQHCQHIIELQKEPTSLILHLRQIPPVLGSLGLVIIDDKEVAFFIPSLARDNTSQLQRVNVGTAVVFTDYEGSLVKEILYLFDNLRLNADPVHKCESGLESETAQDKKRNVTDE